MNVEHVPVAELPSFLERFSRGHRGWLTKVERTDPTDRGEVDGCERPLGGIVSDPDREGVLVFLEERPHGSLRYRIDNAAELRRETADGVVRLEIDSADGSTMVVECHPAGH